MISLNRIHRDFCIVQGLYKISRPLKFLICGGGGQVAAQKNAVGSYFPHDFDDALRQFLPDMTAAAYDQIEVSPKPFVKQHLRIADYLPKMKISQVDE